MVLSLSQESLLRSVVNNIAAHFYLHRHNLNTSLLQTVHFPRVPYKIRRQCAEKNCSLGGVDNVLVWEFVTQDTEKCTLSMLSGVHINPVIFKESIWVFETVHFNYMGVCMKRVSFIEWGSFVLFLFSELDFEQPVWNGYFHWAIERVKVTCPVGNIYLFQTTRQDFFDPHRGRACTSLAKPCSRHNNKQCKALIHCKSVG